MACYVVGSFFGDVLDILKESLQPQGARGLYLGRATRRCQALELELELNMCMVSELFVQILASGLGVLAVVWATAVLLGGFSTSLEGADFWVITAIVFIQTARVVGINVSPEAEFFNQVPAAILELGVKQLTIWGKKMPGLTCSQFPSYIIVALTSAKHFLTVMAFLAILVLVVPMIAGLACISLSIYRLLALLSIHHHNSNVFRALMLFYALVLLQGVLFIISKYLTLYRFVLANLLRKHYRLQDKREFVVKYMEKTSSTAIKNGVSSTINMSLASFAADLIKYDYNEDRTEAVRVIHTLTSQEDHRTRTLSHIQSSPLFVSRLLDMVTSKSGTDQRTKICIAEIVAHLASNLRLADISGATESISYMINPFFTNISTPATSVNIDHQTSIDIRIDRQGTLQSASTTIGADNITNSHQGTLMFSGNTSGTYGITSDQEITFLSSSTNSRATSGAESKPVIIHGLLILAKLAVNPDNCKQIYDSKSLFAKIISPVKNKVYEILGDDGISMEITEKALEVVRTLVSGTDETNGKVRRDICNNMIAVNDILPILKRGHMYNKLKIVAIKILTKLYLDKSVHIGLVGTSQFIKVLVNIFFDAINESGLRKTAAKALAVLAMDNDNCRMIVNFSTGTETSVVQLLTTMISEANNRLYQTALAQLLMQFSANSDSNGERKDLESVKKILHEVLKVICNVEQAGNTNQACSPHHNLGQPMLQTPRLLHRLNNLFRPRLYHVDNKNAAGDSLPVVAQLVGGRRKSLVAFLGLGLQICDKLEITADDFDTALARIPLSMGEFVDKLNDIIEQCKGHSTDSLEGKTHSAEYLIIMKTVTKLCTWMMQSKPDCITEFENKNTSTKLQGALEDMRVLELGMILTGCVRDMAHYETLSTIVANARQKMDANVLLRRSE